MIDAAIKLTCYAQAGCVRRNFIYIYIRLFFLAMFPIPPVPAIRQGH